MLCTLAWSIPSLAAFRAVQGIGAGGLFSLALAIIGDIVPPRERAKYQGYFLAVFGTSSVLGPVIGGFFAGQETILGVTGWRWVFLVNVPIAVAALIVVTRTLHLKHTRLDHRIDYWGALSLSVALVPLLIVAEQGREWGWDSPTSITCYAIGLAGLVAFFLFERAMGEEALIPLRLFTNRTVASSSVASVFIGMGMFGGLAAIPLYLQIVKGSTPTQAGLQLLPMTLGIMAGSIISGQLISRTGRYRHFPIMGAAILVLSLYGFHFVGADTPLWKTMIGMFFFGIGLGFNFQPLTLAVQNAVDRRDMGVATSSATFTRQIGGTLGTAVFLSILFSQAGSKISEAFAAIAPDAGLPGSAAQPDRRRPCHEQGLRPAAAGRPAGWRFGCGGRRLGPVGQLVHQPAGSGARQAVPRRLLRRDVGRLPGGGRRARVRLHRDAVPPEPRPRPQAGRRRGQGRRGRGHPRRPLTGPLPQPSRGHVRPLDNSRKATSLSRSGLSTCRQRRDVRPLDGSGRGRMPWRRR